MTNYRIPPNLSFRVETMFAGKNNRIGVIKPDENGIYKGLPLMDIGVPTQQKTYYDPQSIKDQFTDPNSLFNLKHRNQKAYGELGHPDFISLTKEQSIQRLMEVKEARTSHLFTSVYTDKPRSDGTVILRGDVKPAGELGPRLKEGLDDPVINTSFSLRAYVTTQMQPDGIKYRTVRSLVTFDAVNTSGYVNTDKAHGLGLENLEYDIEILKDGTLMIDQIALESLSDTVMADIFGTSDVFKVITTRTFVRPDAELMQRSPERHMRSLFHDFFKEL